MDVAIHTVANAGALGAGTELERLLQGEVHLLFYLALQQLVRVHVDGCATAAMRILHADIHVEGLHSIAVEVDFPYSDAEDALVVPMEFQPNSLKRDVQNNPSLVFIRRGHDVAPEGRVVATLTRLALHEDLPRILRLAPKRNRHRGHAKLEVRFGAELKVDVRRQNAHACAEASAEQPGPGLEHIRGRHASVAEWEGLDQRDAANPRCGATSLDLGLLPVKLREPRMLQRLHCVRPPGRVCLQHLLDQICRAL
mmetsp:Transcript_11351/g.29238  ORF Transcript_11351/g.29238 Transcript_11351/m.29238 type:complete len:254 (+) Transcript_11351:773-1534(+)